MVHGGIDFGLTLFSFIKAIEGGLHLVSPVVPATASNVSMAVAQLLRSAGLEGSMYAFRRGTANEVS